MAEYSNENRGAIFVNEKKTEENHPDRTGSLNVGGVDYWLSGWLKKTKEGKPYMSLSVKPKEAKRAATPSQKTASRAGGFSDFDDDIPY